MPLKRKLPHASDSEERETRDVISSNRENNALRRVNKNFSDLVSHQGQLVEKQAKRAKEIESRAKQVVKQAKAIRKKADGSELSAIKLIEKTRRP